MDEFQKEESLHNIGLILGIEFYDHSQVINLYFSRAMNFVKSYCNISEIPEGLYSTVEDITVFLYRNKGIENITSEGKGSLSESYRESLPSDIYRTLNEYRRMKFV